MVQERLTVDRRVRVAKRDLEVLEVYAYLDDIKPTAVLSLAVAHFLSEKREDPDVQNLLRLRHRYNSELKVVR